MTSNSIDYKTLLEEIKRIVREAIEESKREDIMKLGDAMFRMATVIEGILDELKKHTKILEEHSKILKEHTRILEEYGKILKEHSEKLTRIEATLGALGGRIGLDLERTILNIYKDILAKRGIRADRVEKISYKDIDGRYHVKGAKLDIDVYVHNSDVVFIEVKSLVEIDDVEWFWYKCDVFEKILGRKATSRMMVAVNIFKDALERARELGLEVVYGRVLEID